MRRVRRWVAVGAALVVVGCGAQAGEPGDGATSSGGAGTAPSDDAGGAVTAEPAGPEDEGEVEDGGFAMPPECGRRFLEPEEPIPGDVFARCTVTATSIAQTAHYLNTDDQGATVQGPVRFADPMEAHLTYSVGAEMVLTHEAGWLMSPEGGWVRADPAGAPEQVFAHGITSTARALTRAAVQESFLASSEQWEPVEIEAEGTDGAWAYSGTPDLQPAELQRYVVWIDGDHLPVRIEHTTSLMGVTVSVVEEYTRWGGAIEIPRVE